MSPIFADTLLNIAVTGPLIRLELGTLNAVPGAEGEQAWRATPSQQLVMPLDGFVRAFGMQEAVMKKLLAQGVVVPQPAAPL